MNLPPLSLYVHIPWCLKKCPYCDFNSHAVSADMPETAYCTTLLDDLDHDLAIHQINRPIHSIFFGGGTPSLFAPESIARLLDGIRQRLTLDDGAEITLEANPGTFESEKFAEFKAAGINRLSIGIQSFDDSALKKLGRVHSAREAIRAAEIAHQVGLANFNLDLMYAIPGASLASSQADMDMATALLPAHISCYQFTLEPNTYFYHNPPELPDDNEAYAIQTASQSVLAEHGYAQYEISAYSKPDHQCRHNLNYWQFGDYLGIGAGAHGKLSLALPNRIVRTAKPKSPRQYLGKTWLNPETRAIAEGDLPLEFLMNQLRLRQGFSLAEYQIRTGLAANTLEPGLSSCIARGWLVRQQDRYQCTTQGWDFLDTVLQAFFKD